MRRIMSPQVTRGDYASLLNHLRGAFGELCPHINAALGNYRHDRLSPVDLLGFLERDLRSLDPDPVAHDALPPLPALGSPDEALGAWYVLEGSAMGGKSISTRLRRSLGDDLPVAYLAERGGRGRERWQQFDAFFEAQLTDEETLAQVTAGANACFAYIAALMAASGPDPGDACRS